MFSTLFHSCNSHARGTQNQCQVWARRDPPRERPELEGCWLLLPVYWNVSSHLVNHCRCLPLRLIAAQSCLLSDKEMVVVVVWLWLYIKMFDFNDLLERVVLLSCCIFNNGVYNAVIFERRIEYLLPEGIIHSKLTWTAFKFRALVKSFVDEKGKLFYMR